MLQSELNMYKKMYAKYKKKHISKNDYEDFHNYNTETGNASYDKE